MKKLLLAAVAVASVPNMPAVWPQPTKAEDEVQCHEEE
jgi:hypothetical protein